MLREINAARSNNQASHTFSESALSIPNMPQPKGLLTEIDNTKQGDTDRRNAGIDTQGSVVDSWKVNLLA